MAEQKPTEAQQAQMFFQQQAAHQAAKSQGDDFPIKMWTGVGLVLAAMAIMFLDAASKQVATLSVVAHLIG